MDWIEWIGLSGLLKCTIWLLTIYIYILYIAGRDGQYA